jgi:hypothetical protein
MKMQAGARTPEASDASRQGSPRPARRPDPEVGDPVATWLKITLDTIIHEQRPRVPGWGLLKPRQSVGEYTAEDSYLLLVFDHRGRPHTQRFTLAEVNRLQSDGAQAAAEFRSLIASFCADA